MRLYTRVSLLLCLSISLISDAASAKKEKGCSGNGSVCVVRTPCHEDDPYCPDATGRDRGAQFDNNKTISLPLSLTEPHALPENSEKMLPNSVFQFWGLPVLPEEKVYVEKLVVAVREESVAKQISADIQPVRFASGKSLIPQFHIVRMNDVLNQLQERRKLRLHFVGHTDNVGLSARARAIYKDNVGLSESRAKEVSELFKSQLDRQDIEVTSSGVGDSQPIDTNDTKEGRARNRRVEIQVWYEEKERVSETVNQTVVVPKVLDSIRTRVCPADDDTDPSGFAPFKISVDGNPIQETAQIHGADVQRCTDVALEDSEIQIQYDNLLLKPRLSVDAWPPVIAYQDDPDTEWVENLVTFSAYSNYRAFWQRAEIRLFAPGQSLQVEPLVVIPLNDTLQASWQFQPNLVDSSIYPASDIRFVLRVYDEDNYFDETQAKILGLRDRVVDRGADTEGNMPEGLSSYGENHLSLNSIAIRGGTVTVNGKDIPADHEVSVMGASVPLDEDGAFVYQQIIPHGYHTVEVAVLNQQGAGDLYHRDLKFSASDWFYVGIADLTFGLRDTNGRASEVTQDSRYDDDSFMDGRLAFYAKGKTSGDWDITASADTRELPLDELFTNFTNKDPTILFRRLDPDYYYPTFGDDSTLEEDAPTQGKFYLRAQKNKNYGLWGNFDTNLLDTELARIDRSLYGAEGHYESKSIVKNGEKKTQLSVHVAEPGTVGAREEFRGTGGSLYFLRHQNITLGSERVRIEIRDKDTDLVLSRKRLIAGSDYDIDPIQGRVILNSPLSSSGDDGLLVRDSSTAGNSNFLVVSYEYTPGFEELDDVVMGGRVSHWFGDHVKFGITASEQEQTGGDQSVLGTDITLRSSSGNYLKLEAAQTEGLSTDQFESFDGGFAFNDTQAIVAPEDKANAGRIETMFTLGKSHRITAFYQTREAGFSSTGQFVERDTDQYGVNVSSRVGESLNLTAKLAAREQDLGQETKTIDAIASYDLSQRWTMDAGVRLDQQENNNPLIAVNTDQGKRTDATLEVGYNSQRDWNAFGFVQGTVDREDIREPNNRAGMGLGYKITDNLNLEGEVSDGNAGAGARIGTDYTISDDTNLYLTFALENERSGNSNALRGRRGNLTSGFKTRYTDTMSIYGEERYAYGDQPTGLTHLYGVDLAPAEAWSIGASIETGELDNNNGDATKRLALGLSLGYAHERVKYVTSLEFRNDKSTGNERDTWLLRNELTYKNNDNWRTLGKLNYSQSTSTQGEFFDGDFAEAIWGYAYRPIDNDRINALIKYTYFFNKPAPEQVSTNNINSEFIQRSHVFSADVNYDVSARWTIGGKYAFRRGELALDRVNPEYFRSDAHLFVVRADWHVVKYWDLIAEARTLDLPDASDNRSGLLVALYRHFGANAKVGLGYNFTEFSDDLTDLSFDSQGVFINVIGKF